MIHHAAGTVQFKPKIGEMKPVNSFDTALAFRAPNLSAPREVDDDYQFVLGLVASCSPMAGLLTDAIARQQAQLQLGDTARCAPVPKVGSFALTRCNALGAGLTGLLSVAPVATLSTSRFFAPCRAEE